MAVGQGNPLEFKDLFGVSHTEPSVTGLIELQTTEVVRPTPVNDLILLSPFRSGQPGVLKRFRQMSSLASYHDPDGTGDQGVALARATKSPFGDDGVFGSADVLTLRTDRATQSSREVSNGGTKLFSIKTGDYGFQTQRSRGLIVTNTDGSKSITLRDDTRVFKSPALGRLFQLQYTGTGSPVRLSILLGSGSLRYLGQAHDGDFIEINGITLEFDDGGGVSGSSVAVLIGGSTALTYDNFVAAVNDHVPGVTANRVSATSDVFFSAPEAGLLFVDGDGTVTRRNPPVTFGKAARLFTVLGSERDVDLALTAGAFRTVDAVIVHFNSLPDYSAKIIGNTNKFLPANEIDAVLNQDIETAAYNVTGFVSAMVDWVTGKTKGQYVVDLGVNDGTYDSETLSGAVYGLVPDADARYIQFTGGISPAVVMADIEAALNNVGSQVERGGILLIDTDDPVVMALTVEFIDEQRALGKWFRAFFGAQPGLQPEDYITIAGSLDSSRVRLVCQRVGVFTDNETKIQFLDPIFLAAALAGGSAGNQPFKNPLTNKRLRFAALHDDDSFDEPTRASLLEGGVTIVKKEFDRLVVTLAVTTSRDPDRRMPRIMSEVDTVDQVDADMRQAFLPFRGKWANLNLAAAVFTVGNAVLNFYSDPKQGALVGGEDQQGNPVPPWSWQEPAFVLFAGVLTLDYQINIGGELDHVSEHGRAEYTRIVGQVPGGATSLQTVVPA